MSDECFEEFEKWWKQNFKRDLMPALTTQRFSGMTFGDVESDAAWKGWKAAWDNRTRDSLEDK